MAIMREKNPQTPGVYIEEVPSGRVRSRRSALAQPASWAWRPTPPPT